METDRNFLAHFITEDIFVIGEDKTTGPEQEFNPRPLVYTPQLLNDVEKDFLYKIFSSVAVTPSEIDVQLLGDAVEYNRTHVFFFGKAPISLSSYEINRNSHQVLVLADSLGEIAQDQQKKRKLWTALQEVFA